MAQLKSYIQLLGASSGDSGPTILLWFDKKRYLFNCSEGTQRFCSENHVKPSKLDTFFFTRLTWDNIGGLAGILFVAASLGTKDVTVCGPPNTVNFVESMRYFLSRRRLTMTTKEFRNTSPTCDESYKDECVTIYPIPLIDSMQQEQFSTRFPSTPLQSSTELRDQDELALERAGNPPKSASNVQKVDDTGNGLNKGFKVQNVQDRTPRPPDWSFPPNRSIIPPLRKLTTDTIPLNAVVCYALHSADTPGKFDTKKADSLGVPAKQRSILVKGNSLELANGTIVQPSDCIGPSIPGKVLLIVDCPNLAILNELISSPRFHQYQQNGTFFPHVACIVHITPADLLTSPPYQTWMNRFHDEVQHLVINSEHCGAPLVYQSSARVQMTLNSLHPGIFPLHHSKSMPDLKLPVTSEDGTDVWPKRLARAEPMLRFALAPPASVGLDRAMVLPELRVEDVLAGISLNTELEDEIKKAQKAIAALPPHVGNDPVDVVFLGTGSATPSKYRNQSSTYIKIRGYGGLLLDAGEGSLGQLSRHFGAKLDKVISQLKFVFISHMHADHHLGLIRILLHHQRLCRDPLLIVGPPLIRGWLFEYCQIEPISYIFADNYQFIQSSSSTSKSGKTPKPSSSSGSTQDPIDKKFHSTGADSVMSILQERLGIVSLTTAPVIHCMDSFGVAFKHQDGWKIAFSGDTRPCDTLISAGKDATLLIHEATFEDSLSKEAAAKCHATTSEAISVANQMNAQFLMMTHFSQRYPKIPVFNASTGTSGVGIAFDLMRLRFSDFPAIPHLTESLKLLFADAPESDPDDDIVVDVD